MNMLTLQGVFEDTQKDNTKRLWFLSIDQYRLRYCCTGKMKMLILDGVFEDGEYDLCIFTAMQKFPETGFITVPHRIKIIVFREC